MVGLSDGEKIEDSCIRFYMMQERDRQTDTHTDAQTHRHRHRMTAKAALDASIARQK